MYEIFEVALPIVLAALLTFVSLRAFRHKRALVRWGVGSITTLLTLVATIVSVFAIAGLARLNAHGAPEVSLAVASTPEQVRRGREISDGFCSACHAPHGETALTGGEDIGKHLPLPLGSF